MQIELPAPGQPQAIVTATGETRPVDVPADVLMGLLRSHGAVLLRGFGADVAALHALVARHCTGSVFNESPDRLLLDAEINIQTVNGGCEAFPLHPELSREPWKPDLACFACLSPPASGGETTICDGIALAAALPPALHAALAPRRLLYIQRAWPEVLAYWLGTPDPTLAQLARPPAHCPYDFPVIGGQIARAFSRPALHKPLFSDAPAFGNFLLFSRYYNGNRTFPCLDDGSAVPDAWTDAIMAAAAPLTVPVRWAAGDLLMLDNSRFMHGRLPIVDADERRIATFFGYLKDAPADPYGPADPIWRRTAFRPPRREPQAAAI